MNSQRRPTNNTRAGLIYGVHAVKATLNNPQRKCKRLWVLAQVRQELEKEGVLAQHVHIPIETVDRAFFNQKLGPEITHQGILLEVSPLPGAFLEDVIAPADRPSLIICLDQVTDPHNVGAILRTAAAFGATAVVQSAQNAPDRNNSTIAKVAAGGIEHIPLITVTNLSQSLEVLKKHGYWCVGLDERGSQALYEAWPGNRLVLIVGAEGQGLRRLVRENCDFLRCLPTQPSFSVLNVSTATAIACYEWTRQRLLEI